MIRLTSGLLPIPVGLPNVAITVCLTIAGNLADEAIVPFQVNTLSADNTKVQHRTGVLAVPPRGGSRLILDDVAGQIIEINVGLPGSGLLPSITFTETDTMDRSSNTIEWLSAAAFTRLPGDTDTVGPRQARPDAVSSGMIPVPISTNEFSPPFSYRLLLLFSSFSPSALSASYELQWARPSFLSKLPLQQGTVGLEPGTGTVVAFDQAEGKTVELNVARPQGVVVQTVAVMRLESDSTATSLVLFVPGASFVSVPGHVGSHGG